MLTLKSDSAQNVETGWDEARAGGFHFSSGSRLGTATSSVLLNLVSSSIFFTNANF